MSRIFKTTHTIKMCETSSFCVESPAPSNSNLSSSNSPCSDSRQQRTQQLFSLVKTIHLQFKLRFSHMLWCSNCNLANHSIYILSSRQGTFRSTFDGASFTRSTPRVQRRVVKTSQIQNQNTKNQNGDCHGEILLTTVQGASYQKRIHKLKSLCGESTFPAMRWISRKRHHHCPLGNPSQSPMAFGAND